MGGPEQCQICGSPAVGRFSLGGTHRGADVVAIPLCRTDAGYHAPDQLAELDAKKGE